MPLLEVENLSCEFNIFSSLRSISFSIEKGENLVVFGTENSGIDHLCTVLTGFHPYSGKICFNGSNLEEMSKAESDKMRREFVYMQGEYGLLSNMSVEENISLPLRYHTRLTEKEIEELVDTLVEELHLDYCRDMRPMNLKPSELLKTSYARSIALDPLLLLIEHPLESQCLLNTITFLGSLRNRCRNHDRSIVITTYEPLRFIDLSNRFIMIDYGKIVFDGTREMMIHPDHEFVRQFIEFSGAGPMHIL